MKRLSLSALLKFRVPLLAALVFAYFAFHLMNGDRGVYAYLRETHQHKLLSEDLAKVKAQRETMEIKVSHLRNDSLDLDLLDEQSRRMLGAMGEGEKMIILETPNP